MIRKRHKIIWGLPWLSRSAVILAAFLLMTFGCGEGDDTAASRPAEPHKVEKVKKGEVAAEAKKRAVPDEGSNAEEERLAYSYNPIGKRDPFRSFISRDSVSIENRPETPLQKYEIDQFRLVAVIWGMDEPVAMVEDPEGLGHFLRKGVLIGKNWGKVVRIMPSEIVVAEEYRDFEGKLIVNEIPLKLPAEKEQ